MPDSSSTELVQNWLNQLQDQGYRLTESRRAVVAVIALSQRLLTATEVFDLARESYPSLGLVTVYRTLEKLEDLALIERVHQLGDCHAYIASLPGHQHLLICQNCGRTTYFSGDRLEPLMEEVARDSGFDIKDHWLQLFGLCLACREFVDPRS